MSRKATESHRQAGRILVVEDDADARDSLCEFLALKGQTTAAAGSAKQASDLLANTTEPFDFVICDFRLPDADGLELIEDVRQRYPSIRPIVLTGDIASERLRAAIGRGLRVAYKPIKTEELLRLLSAH
jgi:DNA-binding NtrC family response regulator